MAILFLATPHRGSDATQLPALLGSIVNLASSRFTLRVRTDLIEAIKKDSTTLKGISTDFRNQIGQIKIASFVEQLIQFPAKSRVGAYPNRQIIQTDKAVKIVDEISGVMDMAGERIIPMEGCDHSSICSFSSNTSNSYKSVQAILKSWADEARQTILQGTF